MRQVLTDVFLQFKGMRRRLLFRALMIHSLLCVYFAPGISVGQVGKRDLIAPVNVQIRVVKIRNGMESDPIANTTLFVLDENGRIVMNGDRQSFVTNADGRVTVRLLQARVYNVIVDAFPLNANNKITLLIPDVYQVGPVFPVIQNGKRIDFSQNVTIAMKDLTSIATWPLAFKALDRIDSILKGQPVGGPLDMIRNPLNKLRADLNLLQAKNTIVPRANSGNVNPVPAVPLEVIPVTPYGGDLVSKDQINRLAGLAAGRNPGGVVDFLPGRLHVQDSWGGRVLGGGFPNNAAVLAPVALNLAPGRFHELIFIPPGMHDNPGVRIYPSIVSVCRSTAQNQPKPEFDEKLMAVCPLAHEMSKTERSDYLSLLSNICDRAIANAAIQVAENDGRLRQDLERERGLIQELIVENERDAVPQPLPASNPVSVLMFLTKSFPGQDEEWGKLLGTAAKYPGTKFWAVCDYLPQNDSTQQFKALFSSTQRPANLHVLGYLPMHSLDLGGMMERINGVRQIGGSGMLVDGYSIDNFISLTDRIQKAGISSNFSLFLRSSVELDDSVYADPYVHAVILMGSAPVRVDALKTLAGRRLLPKSDPLSISQRIGVGVYDSTIKLMPDGTYSGLDAAWDAVVSSRCSVICLAPDSFAVQNGFEVKSDTIKVPPDDFISTYLPRVEKHNNEVSAYWNQLRLAGIYGGF